jgi:hypothetical protein
VEFARGKWVRIPGVLRATVLHALIVALLIGWHGASAMDDEGYFWVIGMGKLQCSAYVKADPASRLNFETWTAGYVTAMNRSTSKNYNLLTVPIEDVKVWLERHCKSKPDELWVHAVHALLEDLYPKRIQAAPKK